jgi:hypothetical protein
MDSLEAKESSAEKESSGVEDSPGKRMQDKETA